MTPPPIEARVIYGGTLYDRVEVSIGGELAGVLLVPGGRGDEIAELLRQGMCKSRVRAIDTLRYAANMIDSALVGHEFPPAHAENLRHARDEARKSADIVEADIRRPEGP